MSIIAETSRISLELLEERDLELIHKWWNDGEITAPMGFPDGMRVSMENLYQRFENQFEEQNKFLSTRMYIIYAKDLEKPIGELQYGQADTVKKKCRLGIKIGELTAQSKGYAKEALIIFIEYLFIEFGMKLIEIDVFPENEKAYYLYKKLGFTEIEVLNNFWTDETGKSHDLVMMELRRYDWKFSKKGLGVISKKTANDLI